LTRYEFRVNILVMTKIVQQIFDPEFHIQGIKKFTITMITHSQKMETIKSIIRCHDIIDLTDRLNQPWEKHPGYMYGDLGAFVDLEVSCQDLWRTELDIKLLKEFHQQTTCLIKYWKLSSGNRFLINTIFPNTK
jgi:hypothetical protein